VLAAVLLVLEALLGLHVRGGTTPLHIDKVGARIAAQNLGRLDSPQFLDKVVWLGAPDFVLPMVAALAVWAWRRRDRFGMALSVVGPVAALVTTEVIVKPLVDRTNGGALAYPSGHVTGATALATVAVLLAYRHGGRDRAALVAAVVAIVPLVVAVGVVRIGWHWATDAAGGLAAGMAGVLATAAALSIVEERARRVDRVDRSLV
jgi:undecaprenyl-diphosphatase